MTSKKAVPSDKPVTAPKQIDGFRKAARELETDDSEMHFDERLKRVAKSPPPKGNKAKADKPGH